MRHDQTVTTGSAGEVPDFASLYGYPTTILSPRLAACLWAAAGILSDTYRGPGGRDILVEDLPPLVVRVADDAWYDRFLVCFETLERQLAVGGFDPESLACCTGEEMALHLTVAMSETLMETGGLNDLEWMAALPPWRAEDDDPEWARTTLFRDHDVLWLFEASLDSVEAPDTEESVNYGLAHAGSTTVRSDSPDVVDLRGASIPWTNQGLLTGSDALRAPATRPLGR